MAAHRRPRTQRRTRELLNQFLASLTTGALVASVLTMGLW